MQDPDLYPEPLRFNGFRFADRQLVSHLIPGDPPMQAKPTRLCDVDNTFHVWGTGRMAWYVLWLYSTVCSLTDCRSSPGRYYAAGVMKVILGKIIMNYDCELLEPNGTRWFKWRSATLPKQSTMAIFSPRKPELL
jgi:hypothetical protein